MSDTDPLPDTEIAVRWIITGRVQAVSFRFFTQQAARALDLRGWVKNLPDGSVEVRAIGPRARVEELRRKVEKGPRLASVEGLAEESIDAEEAGVGEGEFEIRF